MTQINEARERVLNVAEQLFHERGYNAVSMQELADALDIRKASLYYHVPDGKEQLFVEVTGRWLQRHGDGLDEIVAQSDPMVEARLLAAAHWLIDHGPLNLLSMLETDLAAISQENAQRLTRMTFQSFFAPITSLFANGIEMGEIRPLDPEQLAGHFLSMMEGVSYTSAAGNGGVSADKLAEDVVDVILNGVRNR